ncbi:MAG TPA: ABC transporter permease [Bradyrhizobium sp.]|nr:ABC transporter permease [Bradyrhizobium sp.]
MSIASASAQIVSAAPADRRGIFRLSIGTLLLLPALAFLFFFLLVPSFTLLGSSVLTQSPSGDIGLPATLAHYDRLLFSPAYQRVVLRTLSISLWTSAISIILAYPLAMVIAYGRPALSRLTMIVVVAPLVVSVIVRCYGWQLLLGNSKSGVVNWLLASLSSSSPGLIKVMYTEWAVIIASVHVFLPLIVLPIATSLARISSFLIEAARMLGAPPWRAFLRVTLPLSAPGLTAGVTIVFALTAASFVTPQMVGGTKGSMLGILLEQQAMTVFDWPMTGAIASVMVAIALCSNAVSTWIIDFFTRRGRSQGDH